MNHVELTLRAFVLTDMVKQAGIYDSVHAGDIPNKTLTDMIRRYTADPKQYLLTQLGAAEHVAGPAGAGLGGVVGGLGGAAAGYFSSTEHKKRNALIAGLLGALGGGATGGAIGAGASTLGGLVSADPRTYSPNMADAAPGNLTDMAARGGK